MAPREDLLRRAGAVRLIVLDVDGVLTDGGIVYSSSNEGPGADTEMKMFNVMDGAAIRWALREGLQVAFLTGRRSRAVERRAEDLGVKLVKQGVREKGAAFEELLRETGFKAEETAAMGDDLPDLPVLTRAALAACPANAHAEVSRRCHFVCTLRGGEGAVREFFEEIFKTQGQWDNIMKRYLGEGAGP